MVKRQTRLDGKDTSKEESYEEEDMYVIKSALQKSIRRSNVEQAMYWALQLAKKNWFMAWRRLSTIADEDVGQELPIVAVDVLYRKFMALKKTANKRQPLSWDMKRCVVCAAKILAESPKDRRSDEFLELMSAIEQRATKNEELAKVMESLSKVEDYFLDGHTIQGRKMGRKQVYWLEVASETSVKTPQYEKWREWWKNLMLSDEKTKGGSI